MIAGRADGTEEAPNRTPVGEEHEPHANSQSPTKKRGRCRRAVTYLNRDDRPLAREAVLACLAIVAAIALAVQQAVLDGRRSDRQEMLATST